jgi:hypothetical protein
MRVYQFRHVGTAISVEALLANGQIASTTDQELRISIPCDREDRDYSGKHYKVKRMALNSKERGDRVISHCAVTLTTVLTTTNKTLF